MPQIAVKIFGKVQGVFFRVYAKEHADAADILGYVENMSDGTVEIVAQHASEDVLKWFIEKLQEGSPLAQIERIEVNWSEAEGQHDHFVIKW